MTIQNEVLSAIAARRSCRAYQPEQIKPEELQAVLEAGTWAPTGMNRQSPVIVVVQDKETRDKLSAHQCRHHGQQRGPVLRCAHGAGGAVPTAAFPPMWRTVPWCWAICCWLLPASGWAPAGFIEPRKPLKRRRARRCCANGAWIPTSTGALATASWAIRRPAASNRLPPRKADYVVKA